MSIGTSKQVVHKMIDREMRNKEITHQLLAIIYSIRQEHPTLSCRAMYNKINPDFIGRDKFEDLCRENGLMRPPHKNYKRTTNSFGVIRFDNLLVNTTLTGINQAFSSDITYFEINGKHAFITFIMDCFSRRILGYSVSNRLTTEATTLNALKMLVRNRKNQIPEGVIFHSDGGGQYYDKEFIKLTTKLKMRNSMCKQAYENGKAERLNGIIKNNYLIQDNIKSYNELVKSVDRSVYKYNFSRPHSKLNYLSPIEFEKKCIIFA